VLKTGEGRLSVQSGDIVSESDVEVLLSRDGNDIVGQSVTGSTHDGSAHQVHPSLINRVCLSLFGASISTDYSAVTMIDTDINLYRT